ncbi:MAG: hypothetical protein OSA43_08565, partial [Pirellulales bacterium]|nr:hypothetical protein [Pirellulales bacterium]
MAKDFDPYHKWLGIAPEERLPTYYRLLGLNLFESDPDVIEAAADRQMTYLQEVSQGSEVAQAQKLLAEVAEARICLLNQEKKSAYDARLREQLEAIEGGQRLREQGQTPRTEQGSAALRRTKAPKNVVSRKSPTKKEAVGTSTQKRSAKQSVADKSKAVS